MRNCSIKFGEKMIRQFFRENDVMCMIRAHEVQESGYDFINWGEEHKFPDIMTIFSAPNYCGGRNKGAIAYIEVMAD
jgi:serine/threonine-protein phosphatase 2B catalytic subunit